MTRRLVLLLIGTVLAAGSAWSDDRKAGSLQWVEAAAGAQEKSLGPNPPPGTVVVVRVTALDNGDGDGFADTNETVQMRPTLYNRMGIDLTRLVLTLATDAPEVVCISAPSIQVAALDDRQMVTTVDPFTFLVADVARASVRDELVVRFEITMSADQFETLPAPVVVRIDLDLDVSGGSGPTMFFEGFEDGFGTFTPMHLDQELNPPDNDILNREAGLLNSDGYRCQYNDPDFAGFDPGNLCFVGPLGASDAFYYHITSDRAFSGTQSLHWGVFLNASEGFTTPLAQLEGMRTMEPINIGWGRVCSLTRTTRCMSELDCPVGEDCAAVEPTLSIAHQISQMDHRFLSGGPDGLRGVDRAVLHAQIVDAAGAPIGFWEKIHPFLNAYDTQDNDAFVNCSFDPTDDGNDEEDFFDPADPGRRFGPSSTCVPERAFVDQGNTAAPFEPLNIGDASDGPGLEGESGVGTWVESRFDLSRYSGRRIRIRFLESSLKSSTLPTWSDSFGVLPTDDGWFIDDVKVTDALQEPAEVSVDTNENLDIKDDGDFDGIGAVCDCAPADEMAWSLPGEVAGLNLAHQGGASGTTTLSWSPPFDPGGSVLAYDTLVADTPSGFASAATSACIESSDTADTTATDVVTPAPSETRYFLVRAGHTCGPGSLGTGVNGSPRVGVPCS